MFLASRERLFVHIIKKLVIKFVFSKNQKVVVPRVFASALITFANEESQSHVNMNVKKPMPKHKGKQQRQYFFSYYPDPLHIFI